GRHRRRRDPVRSRRAPGPRFAGCAADLDGDPGTLRRAHDRQQGDAARAGFAGRARAAPAPGMRSVHLAGSGLVSALGPDLASAMAALARGDIATQRVQLAPGFEWPLYRIAGAGEDWEADAQRWIRAAAQASGALAGTRRGPLFIASSSLDIG